MTDQIDQSYKNASELTYGDASAIAIQSLNHQQFVEFKLFHRVMSRRISDDDSNNIRSYMNDLFNTLRFHPEQLGRFGEERAMHPKSIHSMYRSLLNAYDIFIKIAECRTNECQPDEAKHCRQYFLSKSIQKVLLEDDMQELLVFNPHIRQVLKQVAGGSSLVDIAHDSILPTDHINLRLLRQSQTDMWNSRKGYKFIRRLLFGEALLNMDRDKLDRLTMNFWRKSKLIQNLESPTLSESDRKYIQQLSNFINSMDDYTGILDPNNITPNLYTRPIGHQVQISAGNLPPIIEIFLKTYMTEGSSNSISRQLIELGNQSPNTIRFQVSAFVRYLENIILFDIRMESKSDYRGLANVLALRKGDWFTISDRIRAHYQKLLEQNPLP